MIAHQDEGMNLGLISACRDFQQSDIANEVQPVEECGGSVGTPLSDVVRESGNADSWLSRHRTPLVSLGASLRVWYRQRQPDFSAIPSSSTRRARSVPWV